MVGNTEKRDAKKKHQREIVYKWEESSPKYMEGGGMCRRDMEYKWQDVSI